MKNVFGDDAEDKPQSVDSAFNDIFGEDELPEEKPVAPAQEAVPEQKVDLDSWNPEPADAGGLFEKSASADMGFGASEESLELEEPVVEQKPEETLELPQEDKTEDKPQSLDSAFADIFGEDELPEELPQTKPVEEKAEPAPAADALDLSNWTPGGAPVEEEVAEPAQEEPSLELPAEEPALELPAEESAKQSLEGEGIGIDKAFDALFAEEDELPEEHAAPAAEVAATDKVSTEEESLAPAEEQPLSAAEAQSEKEELDKEMGAAFSSLFANDDDLPVEGEKTAAAPTEEDTGAEIEEAPLADAALEADLDKSFNSLFGEDDALDESSVAASKSAAEEPSVAASEPAAEGPIPELTSNSTDLESLESEFSGAFKQLFNTDDDSLDEKPVPSGNKGVDFLMSGDSDDEVSAGLVKDPTAPLDKLPPDIDESLNTQTLAEIYFEQGHYDKALDIYKDLSNKNPENAALASRLAEVQKAYDAKFGGSANG